MKKSMRTNILREIRGSFSRFLSILCIVAIGVGFFGGVRATGADMRLSADTWYHERQLMDFRLVSTAGFSEADVSALQALSGVQVTPSHFTDCIETVNGVDKAVRVSSLEDTQQVNSLQLLSGRLPQAANECLVDGSGLHATAQLGSTVQLKGDRGSELSDVLQNTEYVVVGTFESPLYVDASARGSTTVGDGSISDVLMIPQENFKQEVYTQIYLQVDELSAQAAYSQGYDDVRDAWAQRLQQVAQARTPARLQELKEQYRSAISEGEQQLADGRAALEEARAALEDAKAQLDDAARQLAEGERQLAASRAQLDDGWRQLTEGQQQLIDRINAAWAQYDAGMAEYRAQKAKLDEQVDAAADALRAVDTDALFDDLRDAVNALDWGSEETAALRELIESMDGLTEEQRQQLLQALDEMDPQTVRQELLAAIDALQAQCPSMDAAADALLRLKEDDDPQTNLDAVAQVRARLEPVTPYLPQEIADRLTQLLDGYCQLMQGRLTLLQTATAISNAQTAGQNAIDENRQKLIDGEQAYSDGKARLTDARAEYEDGLAEYERQSREVQPQLEDGEAELQQAQQQLADARSQLAQLAEPTWYIFDRDDNPGYTEYGQNAKRMDNIARIFPVLFLLVAALVSLTTMSRMVEEQRTQIGTLKALGYTNGTILTKYMVYAVSAALTGSILGLLVGFQLFPRIIISSYGILYRIGVVCAPFRWSLAWQVTAAATLCIAATVWFSCHSATAQVPARLMRPKAPVQGKTILLERIPFLWKQLDFSRKVSARNIFRYKKRMLMALIGISGCTALVVTGFALKDSISDIVGNQFDHIWSYSALAAVEEQDASAVDTVRRVLRQADAQAEVLATQQKSYTAFTDKGQCDVTVLVPQDFAALPQFISLQDRRTGTPITPAEDEIVITEKMATLLDVSVGDTLTVRSENGAQVSLRVDAITENYVYHYAYMSAETYQTLFGQAPAWNMVLCSYAPMEAQDESDLAAALLDEDGVLYVRLLSDTGRGFANVIGVLNLVVVVLIVSAGALAFVVLYNLTNINITERIREIATLKVLGFYDSEVSAYIFRENVVLTLMGALCGLLLGRWMGMTVITTAEIDLVMFGRDIRPMSYVWAFVITIGFSLIVSLFMHRNLRRISMVESLKSVE